MKGSRVVLNARTPEYWLDERCHITEWWNSPDDPQASIARARVQAGVTTQLHRLEGIAERYVLLAGAGEVEVDGERPQPVGPGDVVVIAPGAPQRITSTGPGDLVFLAICTPRFTPRAYVAMD